MRETQWIAWTRTRLQPEDREELLRALTSQQEAHLVEHDYVWVEGVGILWNSPDGDLRRARFTHGTHFQTPRGEFYIDSEGSTRELLDHRIHPPMPSAPPARADAVTALGARRRGAGQEGRRRSDARNGRHGHVSRTCPGLGRGSGDPESVQGTATSAIKRSNHG